MENFLSYLKESKLSFYFLLIVVYSVGFVYYATYYSYFNIQIINYLSLNEVIVASIAGIMIVLLSIVVVFGVEYYLCKLVTLKILKKKASFIDLMFYITTFNLIVSTTFTFVASLKIFAILFGLINAVYFSYSLGNWYLERKFKEELIKIIKSYEVELDDFLNEEKRIEEQYKKNSYAYQSAIERQLIRAKKNQEELQRVSKIQKNGDYSNLNKKTKDIAIKINIIAYSAIYLYFIFQVANLANINYKKTITKEGKNNFEIVMNNDSVFNSAIHNSLKLIGETSSAVFIYDNQTKTTTTLLKNNVLIYSCKKIEK